MERLEVLDQKRENLLEQKGSNAEETAKKFLSEASPSIVSEPVLLAAAGSRNLSSSEQVQANASRQHPSGYGIIPPLLLQELADRNPANAEFLQTYNRTMELQNTPTAARPRVAGDFNGAREVYDAELKSRLPGKLVRAEGQSPTGAKEADDAYDFTGFVRDFYKKEYGRNSIDGQGMKFISTINYTENGSSFENAFWNGSQMTYGHPGQSSPFKTFVLLDVAAHEITHGVTEKESDFRYYGQSGALNESMSDVFGEMIQQYARKQSANQADWIVGDGIWKDGIKGVGLRNMLNPGTAYDDPRVGKDSQPAHMKDYKVTRLDNGGVHSNSGIPNRAFALFARAVGGNAWDDPGHIWFAARKAAGGNPSFGSFAYQTIEAAKALGHQDKVEKLKEAWEAVGVTPSRTATDTLTPRRIGQDETELSKLKKAS